MAIPELEARFTLRMGKETCPDFPPQGKVFSRDRVLLQRTRVPSPPCRPDDYQGRHSTRRTNDFPATGHGAVF